jgi:AhpD family alkylhydroperoxidase
VTLVGLVEPEMADPAAASTLESGIAQYGFALNTWRALLHRPPIFNAYLPYLRSVVGPGLLDQRIKNLAAVRVAIANHCRYSASHRVRAAYDAGVTDHELAAVAADRLDGFNEAERLAIEFARELSVQPVAVRYDDNPGAVEASLLERLRGSYSDAEIVELTTVISLWNALARFHRVMGLPLDMPPPPPAVDEVI